MSSRAQAVLRAPLSSRTSLIVVLIIGSLGRAGGAQVQLNPSGNAAGVSNAIVGRVTDDSGNPVQGTLVTVLTARVSRQDARSRLGGNIRLGSITDARGSYRIENLTPGSYYPVA